MENLVRRSEKRDSGFEKNISDRLFVIDITKKYFYQLPILILHVKINTNTGHRKDKKPWKKHIKKIKRNLPLLRLRIYLKVIKFSFSVRYVRLKTHSLQL